MSRKLLFIFLFGSFFSLLQTMDRLSYNSYECKEDVYQVYAMGTQYEVTNSQNACTIKDLKTGTTDKVFDSNPHEYRGLCVHPTEPIISLSGAHDITIYNHKIKEYKTFNTIPLYIRSCNKNRLVISQCLFHPHEKIIIAHRIVYPHRTISWLDYSGSTIRLLKEIKLKKKHVENSYRQMGEFIIPATTIFAYNVFSSLLYMEKMGHQMFVFDEENNSFVPKTKNLAKYPYILQYYSEFCDITSDGSFLISLNCNTQNSGSIDVFTCNEQELKELGKINSDKNFVQLVLHPSLPILVTVSMDGLLQYWDIPSQKKFPHEIQLKKEEDDMFHYNDNLSFSKNGSKIILFAKFVTKNKPTVFIIDFPSDLEKKEN